MSERGKGCNFWFRQPFEEAEQEQFVELPAVSVQPSAVVEQTDFLKEKGFDVSLIYSGNEHKTTEEIIKKMSGVNVIGRIEEEPYFDQNVIKEYAEKFRDKL
mgnify:CR=1 FL=1